MAMSGGLARGRSIRVDKTGGAYERVQSPYMGGGGAGFGSEHDGDNVPLSRGAEPPYGHYGEASEYYGQGHQAPPPQVSPYEPYRHGYN